MLRYNLDKTSKDELLKELDKVKDQLADVEEERHFVLIQSAHHINGGTVDKYEAEISSLKKDITELEQLINEF